MHIHGSALNKSTHCWIEIIIHLDGLKEDILEAKVCSHNIMTAGTVIV